MGFDFEIWTGITLFWYMAPVRSLVNGDVVRYGVGFGYGWGRDRVWGD